MSNKYTVTVTLVGALCFSVFLLAFVKKKCERNSDH